MTELLDMRLRNRASGLEAADRERPLRIKLTVPCGSGSADRRKAGGGHKATFDTQKLLDISQEFTQLGDLGAHTGQRNA
jgi:hypothetical protein